MVVQLKSNGTKHTIKKEVFESMSRNQKNSYVVLNANEEQVAENKVVNSVKSAPETGDKTPPETEKKIKKE